MSESIRERDEAPVPIRDEIPASVYRISTLKDGEVSVILHVPFAFQQHALAWARFSAGDEPVMVRLRGNE